jgi:phosphonate transport system permease protein
MNATVERYDRAVTIRTLARGRPRSHFLRRSVVALAALVVYAWTTGNFSFEDFLSERRLANVERFATELKPLPLQGREWDWGIAWQWSRGLLATKGWQAAATTLAISIGAIVLAGLCAAALALPAARTFATPEAYAPHARRPPWARRAIWGACVWITRAMLIFLRAIPEYVWSFLLVAVVGASPWSAVFALALHNAGVLGKLNAEVAENLEPSTLTSLRALGASRRQIALAGILPAIAPRFLLFFFYRWETCVREATVLGMLGIVSLGFFIQDARARQHYDVMFALILIGSAIVLIGDLVSAAAREAVRRSR